jgi:rSAM/selenodomain-associated transferase 1
MRGRSVDSETRNRLVVFTRYPQAGKVKTRLIPALGEEGAADLHCRMTRHTLAAAGELADHGLASVELCYTGGGEQEMRRLFGEELKMVPQLDEGDLGERMHTAFQRCFSEGAGKVVIVGTDCPGLSGRIMLRAFDELDHAPLVLGPARDGGYYLIGLTGLPPKLFEGIPWGTDQVLQLTVNLAKRLELPVNLLIPLDDVDRPEDLEKTNLRYLEED